ncbi:hypothetical protein [Corynebacterium sp. SA-MJD20WY100]|uniref:hypothetical protein n=1 Tax=Corynebacterium sp. SA-MJD20WY100 TaxID=3142969 RepID=UPI0032213B63
MTAFPQLHESGYSHRHARRVGNRKENADDDGCSHTFWKAVLHGRSQRSQP